VLKISCQYRLPSRIGITIYSKMVAMATFDFWKYLFFWFLMKKQMD